MSRETLHRQEYDALIEALVGWCQENLDPTDVYSINDLCQTVADQCDPGSVFSRTALAKWALENGFQPEEVA